MYNTGVERGVPEKPAVFVTLKCLNKNKKYWTTEYREFSDTFPAAKIRGPIFLSLDGPTCKHTFQTSKIYFSFIFWN